jgi:serine/threonine-protein kinase
MPDGKRLIFSSDHGDQEAGFSIWTQAPDASATAERVTQERGSIREAVVSRDGKTMVFRLDATETLRDIYTMPLSGTRGAGPASPIVASRADELMPRLSPDGSLLAYASNETGRPEVYVRPLSGSGRLIVSNTGGSEPVWSRDGKRIFYRNGSELIEATVTSSPLAVSARRSLFEGPFFSAPYHANFDVMPDGEHFVMIKPGAGERKLSVVLGWKEEMLRLVRDRRN